MTTTDTINLENWSRVRGFSLNARRAIRNQRAGRMTIGQLRAWRMRSVGALKRHGISAQELKDAWDRAETSTLPDD